MTKEEQRQQLGRRLIAFNAMDLLGPKYSERAQEFIVEKWTTSETDASWNTIASVQRQLVELEEDGFDNILLDEMKTFYQDRIEAQGCSFDF